MKPHTKHPQVQEKLVARRLQAEGSGGRANFNATCAFGNFTAGPQRRRLAERDDVRARVRAGRRWGPSSTPMLDGCSVQSRTVATHKRPQLQPKDQPAVSQRPPNPAPAILPSAKILGAGRGHSNHPAAHAACRCASQSSKQVAKEPPGRARFAAAPQAPPLDNIERHESLARCQLPHPVGMLRCLVAGCCCCRWRRCSDFWWQQRAEVHMRRGRQRATPRTAALTTRWRRANRACKYTFKPSGTARKASGKH